MSIPRQVLVILVAFILIFVIWFNWQRISMHVPQLPGDSGTATIRGQYGDSYGGLNTLFTGLALTGLVYTMFMQMLDSENRQRERHEDAEEDRFFRLLDLWDSYVSQLEMAKTFKTEERKNNTPIVTEKDNILLLRGRNVIVEICKEVSPDPLPPDEDDEGTPLELLISRYRMVFNSREEILSPYLRTLYHVFKHLKKSDVKDKVEFSKLVRALLSGAELSLLAANCFTGFGKDFKPLVEEFHLLKHLTDNYLCGATRNQMVDAGLNPSAFKE
jgi:Putative phage abortive infection protein